MKFTYQSPPYTLLTREYLQGIQGSPMPRAAQATRGYNTEALPHTHPSPIVIKRIGIAVAHFVYFAFGVGILRGA